MPERYGKVKRIARAQGTFRFRQPLTCLKKMLLRGRKQMQIGHGCRIELLHYRQADGARKQAFAHAQADVRPEFNDRPCTDAHRSAAIRIPLRRHGGQTVRAEHRKQNIGIRVDHQPVSSSRIFRTIVAELMGDLGSLERNCSRARRSSLGLLGN